MVSLTMIDVQHDSHCIHLNMMGFPSDVFSLCNCLRAWRGQVTSVTLDTSFLKFLLKHTMLYCNFMRQWILVCLLLSLTKKWNIEHRSSFRNASNSTTIFIGSADIMKPSTLQDLPYTVRTDGSP
jgi:hypothetical protein